MSGSEPPKSAIETKASKQPALLSALQEAERALDALSGTVTTLEQRLSAAMRQRAPAVLAPEQDPTEQPAEKAPTEHKVQLVAVIELLSKRLIYETARLRDMLARLEF